MPLPILSEVKVTHDPTGTPTVLVDHDDLLTAFPLLNGSQVVEARAFVRAAAIKTFSRGNKSHTFTIGKRTVPATVAALYEGVFTHSLNVKVTTATVRFEVRGGASYDLANATIEAFPARVTEAFLDVTFSIIGGALTLVP